MNNTSPSKPDKTVTMPDNARPSQSARPAQPAVAQNVPEARRVPRSPQNAAMQGAPAAAQNVAKRSAPVPPQGFAAGGVPGAGQHVGRQGAPATAQNIASQGSPAAAQNGPARQGAPAPAQHVGRQGAPATAQNIASQGSPAAAQNGPARQGGSAPAQHVGRRGVPASAPNGAMPQGTPVPAQHAAKPGSAPVQNPATSAQKGAAAQGAPVQNPAASVQKGAAAQGEPVQNPAASAQKGAAEGRPAPAPSGAVPAAEGATPQGQMTQEQMQAQLAAFLAAQQGGAVAAAEGATPQGQMTQEQMQAQLAALLAAQQGGAAGQGGGAPAAVKSLFEPVAISSADLSPDELMYANEVEAALARRPEKSIRVLMLSIGFFFFIMFVWAALASIDEVTRAEGQVISSQRTQEIQNLEGGILEAIMVHEGQVVEKGTPLARLDNTIAGSTYREAFNKALENIAAIIRLEAEFADTEPKFPANLGKDIEHLAKEYSREDILEKSQQIINDHMVTYTARKQQKDAEIKVLEAQFQQKKQEVEEQLSRKKQLEQSLQIAMEQRAIAYPLLQRRNYSRADYLRLEQTVVSLQGDIESIAASLPKAQAAAKEVEQRISFRKAELNAAISEEINKRRTELTSLLEKLSAGGDRVARTELRAPVRGTVKRIYLNTVGGVVKPGESIMQIVPLDDSLLVEARVRPADVAFLHPGQAAVVKVSAYDFSVYGGLEGTLEHISADTIEDKRGDFYYMVKVRTPKTAIVYHNESLPIIPGMMTTVDILTGKKTILDYLLKPILKAQQNALRER